MSAERQPGACLAAHQDALAQGLKEARRDADNAVMLTVRRQGAEHQALPPQDALPKARFPVLREAAAARRDAARMMPAQRRVARPWLKQETLVQMLQASRWRLALRQSGASPDELPSHQRVRSDAQLPERLRDQLQVHAPRRRVLRQPPEQQARLQAQASRQQLQAPQELPQQASPLASLPPWPSRPFPLPQLLQQPPGRGNACALVQRASGQSSSSASFFR
jgi:hypothetical protein